MIPKDPNTEAAKRRMQVELTLLQSDLKKKERARTAVDDEIKLIRKNMAAFELAHASKIREMKKIEQEQMIISNDLASLKKKIETM